IRLRPVTNFDRNKPGRQSSELAVSTSMAANSVHLPSLDTRFFYDYVFDDSADQRQVYSRSVHAGTTNSESDGIIPRAIQTIFEALASADPTEVEMRLSISYLELYNEDLIDLLVDAEPRPPVIIREDKGKIIWAGIKEVPVQKPEEVSRLLAEGSTRRQTASTDMNQVSSRSHAIFSVNLVQKRTGLNSTKSILRSKCHFVDLAGSERLKRTGAIGNRAKEGININAGLLALGNVISALGDASKKNTHVPYRDSKLTRLLQDSIGGNSYTMMIACVSPVKADVNETYNTLKYANRARNIKNNIKLDQEDVTDPAALKAIIQELTEELENLRAGSPRVSVTSSPTSDSPASTAPMYYLSKRVRVLENDLSLVKRKYGILQTKFIESHRSLSRGDSPPRAFPDTASGVMSELSTHSEFHKVIEPVVEEYEQTLTVVERDLALAREINRQLETDLKHQLAKSAALDKKNAIFKKDNEELQFQLNELLAEKVQLQELVSSLRTNPIQGVTHASLEENAPLKGQLQKGLTWENKCEEVERKPFSSDFKRIELETRRFAHQGTDMNYAASNLDRMDEEVIFKESGDLEESFRELQELESAVAQMEKRLPPRIKGYDLAQGAEPDLACPTFDLELEAKESQILALESGLFGLNVPSTTEADELRNLCETLTNQLSESRAAEAKSRQVVLGLEREVESLNEQLGAATERLETKPSSPYNEVDDARAKVSTLMAELEVMAASCEDLKASKSLLESSVQAQAVEIFTLKAALETPKAEESIRRLESEVIQLQVERQTCLKQLEGVNSELAAEKVYSEGLKGKITGLTASSEGLEKSLKSARREIQEQNDLLSLQVERNKALQEENTKLTESYQEAQRSLCMSPPPSNLVTLDEFAALKSEKDKADAQLASLKGELESYKHLIKALEKEMEVAEAQREEAVRQAQTDSQRATDLEKERALLNERLAALQKEHDVVLERNSRYAHQAKLVNPVSREDEISSQTSGSRRSKSGAYADLPPAFDGCLVDAESYRGIRTRPLGNWDVMLELLVGVALALGYLYLLKVTE
ncbi:hypothetical protein L0F63_002401, partial [Massospora cicadina]